LWLTNISKAAGISNFWKKKQCMRHITKKKAQHLMTVYMWLKNEKSKGQSLFISSSCWFLCLTLSLKIYCCKFAFGNVKFSIGVDFGEWDWGWPNFIIQAGLEHIDPSSTPASVSIVSRIKSVHENTHLIKNILRCFIENYNNVEKIENLQNDNSQSHYPFKLHIFKRL
jgi:hypothetical protein